jgi:hypothetical protein
MTLGKLQDDLLLNSVGVLIFIDHQIVETPLDLGANLWIFEEF